MADTKNNTGIDNSGYWNSGNGNSGNWNSGYWNSGDRNSGYGNSGYWNSGNWNSGYGNSGHRNSGNGNSGHWNSGYWNSGDRNSGNGNSGDRNSGNGNSGYGNSTRRSAGIFCSLTPQVISFNKPTSKKWEEIDHPNFEEFYLNKWISESKMSDQEKKEQKDFHVRGGYLKTYTWTEAWANYWRDCDQEEKNRILNLPNFDAVIFKEITGIDVATKGCAGKVVEIDGKKYRLVEE